MYTHVLSQYPCTSGNVYEDKKKIWSFPHRFLNNLNLGLPYSLRMLRIDPPFPIWRDIYWASWMHGRRRTFESKETIVHCCPIFLMLEFASLCPFEHTLLLYPSLPLLCKLAIKMEDWSGGGPGGGLGFSVSTRCRQSLSLLSLFIINRNIYFLSTTGVWLWIFLYKDVVVFDYTCWIYIC